MLPCPYTKKSSSHYLSTIMMSTNRTGGQQACGACTYTYKHTCAHTHTHRHIHAHRRAHTHIYNRHTLAPPTYTHTRLPTYNRRAHTQMHAHTNLCMYTHTRHAYIRVLTHTQHRHTHTGLCTHPDLPSVTTALNNKTTL